MKNLIRSEAIQRLCLKYLSALEQGDLEALKAVFIEGARVYSPIFGECQVDDFYSYVTQATEERHLELKNIMQGVMNPNQVAIYMTYTRTIKGKEPATINTVDIFDLATDLSGFSSVAIIYDTAPVKSDFN
ncbi:nuclear transport factor 2 family protein [Microbulbifer sp. MLAF003]|uniref:nuclear transport factor 2 family protein n=1 Tax=unclassified Microbulbifer TaxID=2619833 RepID=UPI0024AE8143|nr:nuclear transport factor 2 family protein [Microbulbifer sp. MLAF003]WHI52598.1 nuclear transport factor 2 family protein [Microbulbifer sp. MLAF003]